VPIPLGEPAAIDRGRYLVHKVSLCVECHGEDLGGKVVMDSPVMARLWATNLTSGRGGIGATYTDADLVRAMTHGVRKDGRSVIFMPSQDYKFTADDMGALIAYLRSLPPVDRQTPAPVVGPMARILGLAGKFPLLSAEFIDHDRVSFVPAADRSEAAAAGDYVISTAGCRGCHGPSLTGEGGMPNASNLTPVGLGHWSETDFRTAIREARRPNGSTILPDMPRIYKELSDEELHKIFVYLKTLAPAGTKAKNQT
jgi:cytochrome c553